MRQIREEVTFTADRGIKHGTMHARGQKKRADNLLFYEANLSLAERNAERLMSAVLEEALALPASVETGA